MRIIPVLTLNYGATARWLIDKYGERVDQIRYSHNEILLRGPVERLYMVTKREQLLGLQFDEYIISPHYEDMRMIAEERKAICKNRLNSD